MKNRLERIRLLVVAHNSLTPAFAFGHICQGRQRPAASFRSKTCACLALCNPPVAQAPSASMGHGDARSGEAQRRLMPPPHRAPGCPRVVLAPQYRPPAQELSTAPEDSRDDSCLSCAREALNLCYACSPAMGRSKQERAASRDGASGGGGSGDAAGAAAATPSHMLVYARTDCGLCKQAIDTEGEEHIAGEGCGGGGRGSANNPALWLVPRRAAREPLPTGSPLLQASALCAKRFQSTYIVRRM